jgi:putative membrane-bound dehydrogenase-like protein
MAFMSFACCNAVVVAQGFAPAEVENHFSAVDGVKVKLFASEPLVRQAIFVKCDDRGRLWTIQYLQYPNPAGLKRVKVDRWSRTEYDRVPEPPPRGPRGADKITILTDKDGDGRADESKDFVDGLNLATGVEFGHGGVYVLQVPYLLFYADRNRDDIPDGDPEVLLSGFGMEDAQAMVNHLTWGPDGWLYGVNGSTTTCRVRGIEFQQGCWRYHPPTKRFELFCEGGLNCYGLTFDDNGELFYSTNGGPFVHAVQGGYFYKSFGKHGPLHNLFAYHYFPQQECDHVPGGPPTGGTIYLGNSLPEKLRGAFVAGNFLGHTVSWWNLQPNGSTFKATYGGVLFDTRDTWSGPTDFCLGPNGCAYVSDFYDKRTAHPDPDADWDRTNGRIYRIEPSGGGSPSKCDLAILSGDQLVDLLTHDNRWFAHRARVELASRRDVSIVQRLKTMTRQTSDPNQALQALWALEVTATLDDELAFELIDHPYHYVRFWVARILGNREKLTPQGAQALLKLAQKEESPIVLAQLAATAKRLTGAQCLPIVISILDREAGVNDPRVPWLVWWAIEDKATSDTKGLLASFSQPEHWQRSMWRDNSLRLLRRWAADGTPLGYAACDQLMGRVPSDQRLQAFQAIRLGLAERSQGFEEITQGGLFASQAEQLSLEVPRTKRQYRPLAGRLKTTLLRYWREHPDDPLALELALRADDSNAYEYVRDQFSHSSTTLSRRLEFLKLLREFGRPDIVPPLLLLIRPDASPTVFQAALDVLSRFDQEEIADRLLQVYGDLPGDLRRPVREVLFQRPQATLKFLDKVDRGEIDNEEIPVEELRPLASHRSEEIDSLINRHWGNIGPGTNEEKLATMRRLANDLRAAPGDVANGEILFTKTCAKCHQLHGKGEKIGPELTTANRQDQAALLGNLVDPSAVIRREYISYIVTTKSGQVLTGLIAEQDAAALTLLTAENKRVKLARQDIDDLVESDVSLMPEKLLETLTPQELRDLFSYLQR